MIRDPVTDITHVDPTARVIFYQDVTASKRCAAFI